MIISLDDSQRALFASYLEQEAVTDNALADQAEKLGLPGEMMAKKLRAEAMAAEVIARKLRETFTMTV